MHKTWIRYEKLTVWSDNLMYTAEAYGIHCGHVDRSRLSREKTVRTGRHISCTGRSSVKPRGKMKRFRVWRGKVIRVTSRSRGRKGREELLTAWLRPWVTRRLECRSFSNTSTNTTVSIFIFIILKSQGQSYIKADGQSASLSWCRAPIWDS
jgi:hypothetical protein